MSFWSSVRSAGVKTSPGTGDSSKKLPPFAAGFAMVAVAITFSLNHALILRLARLEQQFMPVFLCGLCAPLSVCSVLLIAPLILTHLRQKGYRPKVPTQSASPPHTSSPAGIKTPPPKTLLALSAWKSEAAAQAESILSHEASALHEKSRKPCAPPPARPETHDKS